MATDSEQKLQYVLKLCQNGQKCYFLNQKKVEQKDCEYKTSSLVGQIDCKNTKQKSKLLVKFFVNSFRKNPPISARNVPKLPELSLFFTKKQVKEKDTDLKISSPVGQIERKKRKKKIKLLLEWFANSFRKNPPIYAGNVRKLPQMLLFEPREKSQESMATSKFALE